MLRSQFGFLGYMNTPATFKKEIEQIKENTKCFHSKVPYTSDILGIPVDVKVKAVCMKFKNTKKLFFS